MMTEYEAWKYLAKKWNNPRGSDGFAFVSIYRVGIITGLCGCISRLHKQHKISDKSYRNMKHKLFSFGIHYVFFYWPRNYYGACCRASFCDSQVKRFKKKA